jgi:hypothetical protein
VRESVALDMDSYAPYRPFLDAGQFRHCIELHKQCKLLHRCLAWRGTPAFRNTDTAERIVRRKCCIAHYVERRTLVGTGLTVGDHRQGWADGDPDQL